MQYFTSNLIPKVARSFIGAPSESVTRTHHRCSASHRRPNHYHHTLFLDCHEPPSQVTYYHFSTAMNPIPSCTTCMGQLCETSQRHGSFPWAVVWTCLICDVQFYCCDRTCGPKTRQRTPFVLHDQLVRHTHGTTAVGVSQELGHLHKRQVESPHCLLGYWV